MSPTIASLLRRVEGRSADPCSLLPAETLTIFGVVSFLMIVATFVLSGLCMSNFGRGLKERMPNDGWHCFEGRSRKHRKAMAAVDEGRMELD